MTSRIPCLQLPARWLVAIVRGVRGIACSWMVRLLIAGAIAIPASAASDVRISQVYGGGGNSGAPFNADFVELYNSGASDVNVGNWVLSYTSNTGSFGENQLVLPPNTMIRSKGYLLVRVGARGTTGTEYDADASGITIDMSATAGNIALLTAAQSGTTNTCASLNATLVDKVGYGSGANCAEGTVAAAPSNTTAIRRRDDGAVDADSNSADFFAAVPFPRSARTRFSAMADLGSNPSSDGWSITSTGSVASGVTTSSTANVAIGNPAWSLAANGTSNTSIAASRTFTTAAVPSEVISLRLEHGAINSGASLKVEYLNGASTALTFQYVGGQSSYQVIDSSGTVASGVSTTNDALLLSLSLRGGSSYAFDLNAAGTPYARTGTLAGSAASISGVRITVANTGSGNTVYMNDLRVERMRFSSTLTSWSIPNNSSTGQAKTFSIASTAVPTGSRVEWVGVTLTGLANDNVGDVEVFLKAPDGTEATVFSRVGATSGSGTGDSSNVNGTYWFIDGSSRSFWTAASDVGNSTVLTSADYFPSAALTGNRSTFASAFASSLAAGTWTLTVKDRNSGNNTTLTSATVTVRVRPDLDTDGDGTPDAQDGCPNDPNKTAAGACGCGVADTDSDGDGT
ncbi:MAG: hypothetical protein RLZZ217_1963, partial [Planctomycetota bacterium]